MKRMRIVQREPVRTAGNFDASLPPLLQRLYLQRGITEQSQLQTDLAGLPSPDRFKGMADAVQLLVQALQQQQRICIVGDFDADGATSTALAVHALRAMGARADFLVPNRFEYGYGLTPEIVEVVLAQQSPDLIITVDNGISSWEGVTLAKQHGVRVLVTDHHLPGQTLPDADAIVNPNQPGCDFPSKNIAGVGVIFYVMSAVRKTLREQGYFSARGIAEPNLAEYLDLVALGTVADVVALDFYNRILVQQGLLRIRAGRARPGLQALMEMTKRTPSRLVADDLGFALAPRLNAAGRMDDMSTGIRCLLSTRLDQARSLAAALDELNRERKSVEQGMQEEARAAVDGLHLQEGGLPWGLCVMDDNWHQGVVGLLASRLKERYHRPVIAFAPADAHTLKGSARSIEGLHMRDAIEAVSTRHPGLVQRFGGHAMAAGLSLSRQHFIEFAAAFDHYVRQQLDEADLHAVLLTDGELAAADFQLELARALRQGGPWGQRFPAPLFHGHFRVRQQRLMGEQHMRLQLELLDDNKPATAVEAVAFFVEARLREQLRPGVLCRMAYRLDVNEYRGEETLQLVAEYLELA